MTQGAPRRIAFHADLAFGAALTIAAMLAVLAGIPLIIRLPLVVLLALFLPGYAVQAALLVKPGLASIERVLIALAASIGLTILAGLAMATVGVELVASSWVVALSLIALVGFALAWLRRTLIGVPGPVLAAPGMPWRQAVLVGLAVVIVADILLVSRIVASSATTNPPTQLWMVAGENPSEAQVGVKAAPEGGHYELAVSVSGRVVYEEELTLSAAEVWQVVLVLNDEDRQRPVVARLYEFGSDVEMRYVVLQPPKSAAMRVDGS